MFLTKKILILLLEIQDYKIYKNLHRSCCEQTHKINENNVSKVSVKNLTGTSIFRFKLNTFISTYSVNLKKKIIKAFRHMKNI